MQVKLPSVKCLLQYSLHCQVKKIILRLLLHVHVSVLLDTQGAEGRVTVLQFLLAFLHVYLRNECLFLGSWTLGKQINRNKDT